VHLRCAAVVGSVTALVIGGAATACGSFGEAGSGDDAKPDASTAATDDAATNPDAAASDAGPPRCDPTKPFSIAPVAGDVNTTAENETYAALSEDELTIYFSRGGGMARDIWRATRTTPSAPFANAQPFTSVNSAYLDDGLTISRDGLLAVLGSGRPMGGPPDLFFSKRESRAVDFPTPTKIPGLEASGNDNDPYLVSDSGKMYFASDREGQSDIFVVTVAGSTFGPPVKVGEVSSTASDGAPVASVDDMEIFIASGRAGGTGERTFHARRPAPGMPFEQPVEVSELNVADKSSIPSWLSPDRCVLYYSTDRAGTRDMWVATRGM
jgi:hypothetical protein